MRQSILYVVGIGPGHPAGMTEEARRVIEDCEVIAGYPLYLSLLDTDLSRKTVIKTGMTGEEERCRRALQSAAEGKKTALVCSGDPGVYGMAGLVLAMQEEVPGVTVRVIPGVTAATAGAALLGAPLMHDFAVISLSDRLTPWEKIEKRLLLAAEADLVIVLYNPESKSRSGYLQNACSILLTVLPQDRPAATARYIAREGEEVWTGTVKELMSRKGDMFTTVYIGNSTTILKKGKMITRRGYPGEMRGREG
ncbi:MAG: precorrin-3B C(17)-methyltransferase [Eubacterium sp.]|nr:precorrin-3B C(17)-methyltransferase [Eubacterium sp.]